MSLFKKFNLPTSRGSISTPNGEISPGDSPISNAGGPTFGAGAAAAAAGLKYAKATGAQLLNEGYAKVQSTFGGVGGFVGLASKLPSFAALGSIKGALGALEGAAKGVLGGALTDQFAGLAGIGQAASAANLEGASCTAAQLNEELETDVGPLTSHKVMLTSSIADGESTVIENDVNFPVEPLMERRVEFDVMPEVSEVRSADYEALSTPHMPGEFQKYRGTKSTSWQIIGVFTARTRDEAKRNYIFLNTLRGWTMPYFGNKQGVQFKDSGKLGAPPPVIQFSGWRSLVGKVPVVITGLNWNFPKDCDWIPTGVVDPDSGQEIPFPTVMNVNIQMVESFSAAQFNGFDLVAFRNGRMVNAFKPMISSDERIGRSEPTGGQQGITNGTPEPTDADEHSTTVSEANESAATPTQSETPVEATPEPAADPATAGPPPTEREQLNKQMHANLAAQDKARLDQDKALEAIEKNMGNTSGTFAERQARNKELEAAFNKTAANRAALASEADQLVKKANTAPVTPTPVTPAISAWEAGSRGINTDDLE